MIEKYIKSEPNRKLGILKWFNEEKGIGLIGTVENGNYFIYQQDSLSKKDKLKEGNVFVFEEEYLINKKIAKNCKIACDYADFHLALNYISKNDVINVELENEESFSIEIRQFSSTSIQVNILTKTVFQILKEKNKEERLSYISEYFKEKLSNKSAIEQFKYLVFIKTIFETYLKYEHFEILTIFFSHHSIFLVEQIGFRYSLWLTGYNQENDYSLIAKQMLQEPIRSSSNPFQIIFEKLINPSDQINVLKEFLALMGRVDNGQKYTKIISITELIELDKKVKENFIIEVINHCDDERKYLFWIEGYTIEKNISYIATKIIQERNASSLNQIKKIFKSLKNVKDQKSVLKEVIKTMGSIDSEGKYQKIKYLAGLNNIDDNTKKEFLNNVFNQCDTDKQYRMWIQGYTENYNLNNIIEKMNTISFNSYSKQFKNIFKNFPNSDQQEIILIKFLTIISDIDSEEKFKKVSFLAELIELDEKIKNKFLISAYNQCDNERKYLLWFEGFIPEKDIRYIAKKITQDSLYIKSKQIKLLFYRLNLAKEQETVLMESLKLIGYIDNQKKYELIESLADLPEIQKDVKTVFLKTVFDKCNIETRYLMYIERYVDIKDLTYIAKQIFQTSLNSNPDSINTIFLRLNDDKDREYVLKECLKIIGNIDNEEKYKKVKLLASITILNNKIKEELLSSSFLLCNEIYKIELFLDFWQYKEEKNHVINDLFNSVDLSSFYYFCSRLLNPLAKINSRYYYTGYSFLKIFIENKDYIKETNARYNDKSIFIYRNIYLNENHFLIKIGFFKIILSYINENKKEIENKVKTIIDTRDDDKILNFLNNFKAFNSISIQLKIDLEIEESNEIPYHEEYIVKRMNSSYLLKYWIHGLITYFDYNNFCYYYFTLTLEERKIFNKKAIAIMGEEIKTSMLKKRMPWNFIEKSPVNEGMELEYYTANWKSIWFEDNSIRICMDNTPNFSKSFMWDFSEEKFNFLYEYISGRRLKDLRVVTKGPEIQNIEGLDDLEELIWKISIIQEVESSDGIRIKGIGTNRIPVNMILRNQCIQLLNNFQLNGLEPTRVLEKTFNPKKGGINVDISLLYSIPINQSEVAIIWESLELEKAKATHIFKCTSAEYDNIFSEIELYLSGNLKVRSYLNSKENDAINHQRKLRYISRIEHNNFYFSKWESSLYEILPDLKIIY